MTAKTPTAKTAAPLDPIEQLQAKAAACRREHKAIGGRDLLPEEDLGLELGLQHRLGEVPIVKFVEWLGIARAKFYEWRRRYGKANEHNAKIPRDHWIEQREREAIVAYFDQHPLEGYRRLTFMMLDDDIVTVSPATVYRVLRAAGRLDRNRPRPTKKGTKRWARIMLVSSRATAARPWKRARSAARYGCGPGKGLVSPALRASAAGGEWREGIVMASMRRAPWRRASGRPRGP